MSWINILYKLKSSDAPNSETALCAHLHVNYWKLPLGKEAKEAGIVCSSDNYSRLIDIGILLRDVDDNIEELVICLPFRFNTSEVIDLSTHLYEEKFISYLFCHPYRVLTLKDCPTYRYAKKEDDDMDGVNFCIYELWPDSLDTEDLTKGTMLHLKFLSYPKNLNEIREKANSDSENDKKFNVYVRFRIRNLKENDFCFCEDISNDFIQSAFSKTEMAEIKFNEKKTINHNDYQRITNGRDFLALSKIHFFFTGSSDDENVIGNKMDDCELLDPEIWKDYIFANNKFSKKCISYHWSVDTNNSNHVFFRTIYSSRNIKKIIKYALVVIAMGFIGSGLVELVVRLLTCFCG